MENQRRSIQEISRAKILNLAKVEEKTQGRRFIYKLTTVGNGTEVTYSCVLYKKNGKVANIILNRPEVFNAITPELLYELQAAVERANADPDVRVILLSGAGKAFCSGYDLKYFAESKEPRSMSQAMPWDPLLDYQFMNTCTQCMLSLWRSWKPVITKVQGYAVAGGSDMALCSDMIIMSESAKNDKIVGYPPARIWGCPTTHMWVYRVGLERAKRMLLTGDVVSGKEAKEMGLITSVVPEDKLDEEVEKWVQRMATMPANQLMMQKLVINKAYEMMGMGVTQTLATVMDGIARHTPEGIEFKRKCEEVGFKEAVKQRDRGTNDFTAKL